jgi:threonine/homoserine/homoserine lactone efflux protein
MFDMDSSYAFLITGVVLGLTAGISPGPLMALVFVETMKYGKKEGAKIAVAPLITDFPIIIFVFFVLSKFSGNSLIIGIITLFGAGYLAYLGIGNLRTKEVELELVPFKRGGILQGVITNFLSPHPYLFWLSIGGPIIFRGEGVFPASLFIIGFFSLLVGTKIGIALLVDKSRDFVESRLYVTVIRALGIALVVFALIFLKDGVKMIGGF